MPEKLAESRKRLVDLGKGLVSQIDKEENPAMDVPIRALSNVPPVIKIFIVFESFSGIVITFLFF